MCRPETIGDARNWGFRKLKQADIDDPGLSADLLLAHCLDVPRLNLPLMEEQKLCDENWSLYVQHIEQRSDHRPLQYITGEEGFYGRTFHVDERALIPRPETERLVEHALTAHDQRTGPGPDVASGLRVCDLGTGAGVILLTILMERPGAQGAGVDLSEGAIELTRENAREHALEERVKLIEGDFLTAETERRLNEYGPFDLVISNPPYVADDEMKQLDPEVREHEPLDALKVPRERKELYASLAQLADRIMTEEGVFALETAGKEELSTKALKRMSSFSTVDYRSDHRGVSRFLIAVK